MPDVLLQTQVSPELAAWVKRRATDGGVSTSAWLRRLLMMQQQSVTVRAWVPDPRTGFTSPDRHDLMLERIGAEVDGNTQFRVLEPDGSRPCAAATVMRMPLFESMQRFGIYLDGERQPWRVVTSLADSNASGQLVLFLRSSRAEPPRKTGTIALKASDGAVFMVEPKVDGDGDYFEVRDPSDFVLGKIRLMSKDKAACLWNVVMLDRYSAEIVQHLRDRGF